MTPRRPHKVALRCVVRGQIARSDENCGAAMAEALAAATRRGIPSVAHTTAASAGGTGRNSEKPSS